MLVQKQKFSKVAIKVVQQIDKIGQIRIEKDSFISKIDGRVWDLFRIISQYPTLSSKQLSNILQPSSVRLLIQNKKYFTVEDLCQYLGITPEKGAINRNEQNQILQPGVIHQLEGIINKQVALIQGIRNILKKEEADQLFNQIDFFNNGYIDANSFLQFLAHHLTSDRDIQAFDSYPNNKTAFDPIQKESICKSVLRFLKGSATIEKIFYDDFCSILNENDQNPELPQADNHQILISRSVGHIARVSDIETLNSRNRRPKNKTVDQIISSLEQSQTQNITISNNITQTYKLKLSFLQENSIGLVKDKVQLESIKGFPNENNDQVGYQQKVCSVHWRNKKYMEKIKLKNNFSNLKKLNGYEQKKSESYSGLDIKKCVMIDKATKMLDNSVKPIESGKGYLKINKSEITYQIRHLSNIYNRLQSQIRKIISQNHYFSIINAFNAIDTQDRGFITLKQLKQFLFEINVLINEQKVADFFNMLANPQKSEEHLLLFQQSEKPIAIFYSDFASKLFNLKSIDYLFLQCRRRKPLLAQQWPRDQKKNYCKFIRSVINIFSELLSAKNLLKKMSGVAQEQKREDKIARLEEIMQDVFESADVHYEKFKQIIGHQTDTLIGELFKKELILQPKSLLQFLQVI